MSVPLFARARHPLPALTGFAFRHSHACAVGRARFTTSDVGIVTQSQIRSVLRISAKGTHSAHAWHPPPWPWMRTYGSILGGAGESVSRKIRIHGFWRDKTRANSQKMRDLILQGW